MNIFENTDDLYKCYKIITEKDGLLDRRGYTLDEEYKNLTYTELNIINSQQKMTVIKSFKENKKLYIIFIKDLSNIKEKKKKSEQQQYLETLENKENIDLIFFYYNYVSNITSSSNMKKLIDEFIYKHYQYYELFHYKNLLFNITKHISVPKHEIMHIDEIEEIKTKLNIENINHLQKIYVSDPVAKFYGMKLGDICKITRYSNNSGYYTNYRLVVDRITN